MLLPRFYKVKFVLLAICSLALFTAVRRFLAASTDGKIHISEESRHADAFTGNSFLREVAQVGRCDVCYGRDYCGELARPDLEISRTIHVVDRHLPGVYQVFSGSSARYWLQPLRSYPLSWHSMGSFEDLVCRNASLMMAGGQQKSSLDSEDEDQVTPCRLSEAARESFLYSSAVDTPTLRALYKGHLASRRRIPVTTCPTFRLVDALVSAFDFDDDKTLKAEEKAALLTSLSTWPHLAVQRVVRSQGIRVPSVNLYGTCGRVAVVEPAYKPLSAYLDQSLEVRKGLAIQVLRLLEGFADEDHRWALLTADVSMDNLVVTNAGQVALLDMSSVMILDRETLDDDEEEEEDVELAASANRRQDKSAKKPCDLACLNAFYDRLMDVAKDESMKLCFGLKDKMELMFAMACRNVLSDTDEHRASRASVDDQRGLLHSVENQLEASELESLLRSCVDEAEPGERMEAVLNLVELIAADFDNDEEEEDGDDDHKATGDEDFGDSGDEGGGGGGHRLTHRRHFYPDAAYEVKDGGLLPDPNRVKLERRKK